VSLLTIDEIRAAEGLAPLEARSERGLLLKTRETRNVPFADRVELRESANGTGGTDLTFTGYASVTDTPYEMQDWLGPYTEVVRSGAFTKTLSEGADVAFLVNHEGLTLARTKSGTLALGEDAGGLTVEARLDAASPHVLALRSAMDRGDVDEMSMAFRCMRQEWSPDYMQRDIIEVSLDKGDVSAVNYGANPYTTGATMRKRAAEGITVEALGLALRELRAGASISTANMAVLQTVLDLVAEADTAVDLAQVVLSDLMGVPNPDDPDEAAEPEEAPEAEALAAHPLGLYTARARLLALSRP